MGFNAKRVAIAAVVIGVFVLLWASIAFGWPAYGWIVWVVYALLGVGIVVGVVRRSRHSTRRSSSKLSASDAYSDLQLGRRPPTFYPRDEVSTSQIGDPPPRRDS